jgi:hypothetical protein
MWLAEWPGRPVERMNVKVLGQQKSASYSLHPGAGTIKPEIISSLIIGGSDGGGGHTNDSMMSSVERKIPARSGGSTRDDLHFPQRELK